MFKSLIAALVLAAASLSAHALQPYIGAEKVAATDLNAAMAAVEKKLVAAGFAVVGRHTPKGVAAGAVVTKDVPPGVLAVGAPARFRPLPAEARRCR